MSTPKLTRTESFIDEWRELDDELVGLQKVHSDYLEKIKEMKTLQDKCISLIAKQRYGLKKITDSLSAQQSTTNQLAQQKEESLRQVLERKQILRSMEEFLPHDNGIYLRIILGKVNVSLLSKSDRLNYKQNYENFKLVLNVITFIISVLLYWAPIQNRAVDAFYHFLFVWYYCTLTIRESILKVNGSKIKGWWMAHHFITTAAAGILLVWPDGYTYWAFRQQFMVFCAYLSVVQVVQFYYQMGILYRLRALGQRCDMDITLEGFHSWMFKGFTSLLPFLFFGYAYQLYNAYALYHLYYHPECVEWQVPVLGVIFLFLALGNLWTTMMVVKNRYASKFSDFFSRNQYRLDMSKAKEL